MAKKKKREAPEVYVERIRYEAVRVAASRIVVSVKKSVRLNFQRELEQRPEFILNELGLADALGELADAETRVRELALEGFAELALKGPFSGIGIRENEAFEHDRDEALAWAKVNMPAAVKETVDLPMLKAALKAMPKDNLPEWASFKKVPQATIAGDLTAKVPQEELVPMLPSPEDLDVTVVPTRKYPRNWKRIREQVLARDGDLCTRCGEGEADGKTLEVDHIWPVSLGGSHDLWNLRTLCREECHGKLQIRSLAELEDVGELVLADG